MNRPFRILDPAAPSPEFRDLCALAVMSKAPLPGKVKTRLSPRLTPEEAAALNANFLRDTLASLGEAARVSPAACVVSYTPVGQESAFAGILPSGTLLLPQREGDFGQRLLATATDLFACGFAAVCLIDSDSPTVPTEEFARAAAALLPSPGVPADRVVLGRSDDGGYYLLGLTRPHAQLFAGIAWSTGAVARETEQRAAELGLPVTLLATWYDVDDARSLARLQLELSASESAGSFVGLSDPPVVADTGLVPPSIDATLPPAASDAELVTDGTGQAALRPYPAPHTRAFLAKLRAAASASVHG